MHVVLVYALCQPVILYMYMNFVIASSFIPPPLHFQFLQEFFLMNSCLYSFNKNCYMVLPTYLLLMRHPSTCTNEWLSTASTLCPIGLLRKKAHEVSRSYAQKEAQNDHLQRISYIRVAVLKATLFPFRR